MFDRAGRRPGIMMLNTKMQPVGWLPIGGLLRGELRNTGGMNALFRAASESSMESAIIVHGGELDGKIDREFYPDLSIAENIGAALELGDIRVVDILRAKQKTGFESAAEFGNRVSAGPVLSRRTASGNAALTGKQYSAKIKPSSELLNKVYEQFGDVESEFRAATGYGFDALTESEARYMAKHNEAKSVRDRIIEAGRQALNGADEKNTGFSRKEDVTIENTRARTDAGMDVVTLEKLAQRIKAKMPNMPMVNVLADPSQAPDALRDYILEQGA